MQAEAKSTQARPPPPRRGELGTASGSPSPAGERGERREESRQLPPPPLPAILKCRAWLAWLALAEGRAQSSLPTRPPAPAACPAALVDFIDIGEEGKGEEISAVVVAFVMRNDRDCLPLPCLLPPDLSRPDEGKEAADGDGGIIHLAT